MLTLFPESQAVEVSPVLPPIPGLVYEPGFVSQAEHDELVNFIDENEWMDDLKRRVQHYGYKYDYRAREINADFRVGELPVVFQQLGNRLYKQGYLDDLPDQAIVNEYLPGQGIYRHIDCEPCFRNYIVSVSLLAPITMEFSRKDNEDDCHSLRLEPRSILVLKDSARYEWYHGIAARKTDRVLGQRIARQRRVSITFRKVILA
jgi:alkylated DNA repair dioxygenase AlkB